MNAVKQLHQRVAKWKTVVLLLIDFAKLRPGRLHGLVGNDGDGCNQGVTGA